MATITYNRPLSDFDLNRAASVDNVTTATNSHVIFSDGEYSADLSGLFAYGNTAMSGWISKVVYSRSGEDYLTISNLNVNVKDVAKTNYYDGNDTYFGSSGNDVFGVGGATEQKVHLSSVAAPQTLVTSGQFRKTILLSNPGRH